MKWIKICDKHTQRSAYDAAQQALQRYDMFVCDICAENQKSK